MMERQVISGPEQLKALPRVRIEHEYNNQLEFLRAVAERIREERGE